VHPGVEHCMFTGKEKNAGGAGERVGEVGEVGEGGGVKKLM